MFSNEKAEPQISRKTFSKTGFLRQTMEDAYENIYLCAYGFDSHLNTMDLIHLPKKHLPERTFLRKTPSRYYIIQNVHFPERALTRNYISLNEPLPKITFP